MTRRTSRAAAITSILVACGGGGGGGGGGPSTPQATSTAAPSSSAAPAASATAAPKTERCNAALARKRPAGWKDSGTLTVTIADDRPTRIAVADASGKSLGEQAVEAQKPEDARRALREAVCRAGGVVGVLEGKPPKSGTATIAVVRPAKEDEAGDVAMLCKEPAGMPADLDAGQKMRVAFETYDEQLTSAKWRGWLHDMSEEMEREGDAGRATVRKKYGATLESAPGAPKPCWFASRLKS
jgi:hypothetical protein